MENNGYLCGKDPSDCALFKSTMDDCRGNCILKVQDIKKTPTKIITNTYAEVPISHNTNPTEKGWYNLRTPEGRPQALNRAYFDGTKWSFDSGHKSCLSLGYSLVWLKLIEE